MEEEEEEGSRARSRSRSRSRIRDKSSSAQSEKIAKVARYAPILTVEAQRAGQEDNVEIWRQRLDELLSKDAPKGISKTAARAENRLFNQSSVTETSTLGTTHKRKFLGTSHHLQSKRSKLEAESMSYPTFHYPKSTHTYTTISGFIPVRTPTDGIQNLFFQRPPTGPYPFASLLDRKLELLTEGHVCDRPFPERHVPEIANHMADWWDTYHREASVPRALLQDFLGEAISLEQENWTYNPYAGNCVDIYVPTAASSPDGVSLEYLVFAGGDDHRTLTFLPQGQSTKPAIDSITFRFPILQISVSAARPVPTTSRILAVRTHAYVSFLALCTPNQDVCSIDIEEDQEWEVRVLDTVWLRDRPCHVASNPIIPTEAVIVTDMGEVILWRGHLERTDRTISLGKCSSVPDIDGGYTWRWKECHFGRHARILYVSHATHIDKFDYSNIDKPVIKVHYRAPIGDRIYACGVRNMMLVVVMATMAEVIDLRNPDTPLMQWMYHLKRDPPTHVQIISPSGDDQEMSRLHIAMWSRGGEVFIHTLSTPGSRIDGQQIPKGAFNFIAPQFILPPASTGRPLILRPFYEDGRNLQRLGYKPDSLVWGTMKDDADFGNDEVETVHQSAPLLGVSVAFQGPNNLSVTALEQGGTLVRLSGFFSEGGKGARKPRVRRRWKRRNAKKVRFVSLAEKWKSHNSQYEMKRAETLNWGIFRQYLNELKAGKVGVRDYMLETSAKDAEQTTLEKVIEAAQPYCTIWRSMELQNPPVFAYNQDGGALKPFAINTIFRDDSVHSVLDSHSSHLVDPLRPIKIPKCFGGDVISAIGDAEDGNSISSRILWQDTYLSTFAKPYRGPSKLPADGKLVKQTRSSKLTCYTLPPPNLHHEYELNPLFKRWVNSHSFYGQTGPSFIIPQQEARQPPQLQSQKSAPSTPSTSPRINAKSQERVSSYMDMDVDEDGYEAEEDWSATPKRSKPSQSRPPTLSQSLSMMITPSQESLIHLASSSSQSQSQSQSTQLATPSQLSQPGLSLSQPSPSMFFSQSQRTPKGPSSHKKKKYTPGGKRRVKGF